MFIHEHFTKRKAFRSAAGLLFIPLHLFAVEVLYEEVSSPEGLLSNSRTVDSSSVVTSSIAPMTSGSYSFAEWQLNGIRQEDFQGRSVNPFSFTIYEPTVVTAVYLPTSHLRMSVNIKTDFESAR